MALLSGAAAKRARRAASARALGRWLWSTRRCASLCTAGCPGCEGCRRLASLRRQATRFKAATQRQQCGDLAFLCQEARGSAARRALEVFIIERQKQRVKGVYGFLKTWTAHVYGVESQSCRLLHWPLPSTTVSVTSRCGCIAVTLLSDVQAAPHCGGRTRPDAYRPREGWCPGSHARRCGAGKTRTPARGCHQQAACQAQLRSSVRAGRCAAHAAHGPAQMQPLWMPRQGAVRSVFAGIGALPEL